MGFQNIFMGARFFNKKLVVLFCHMTNGVSALNEKRNHWSNFPVREMTLILATDASVAVTTVVKLDVDFSV